MVFSSIPFLFYFLPALLFLYFAVLKTLPAARNIVLLAISLIFYTWGEGVFVLILLGLTVINHILGVMLARAENKALLAFGIIINLIPLVWYKYAGFIVQNIGVSDWQGVPLLLGISFFTFQAISYLVDLYRHRTGGPKSWVNTALYIAAFPQLIAGPIVRYHTIADQLENRKETLDDFVIGLRYFIIGLGQKVLFANMLGKTADLVFVQSASDLSPLVAWTGIICFTLQIYFDFAGYSNMAIGLGRMFGFHYPQNFNFPYIAQSVREFWTRWHITLSNWFRDYVYIPLGGNKHGLARTLVNLWIVFLLCGFWHGAAWTFIAWGAWQGVFLTLERLLPGRGVKALPAFVTIPYTLLAVMLGWVLFNASTIGHAVSYYGALFGMNSDPQFTDTAFFISAGGWVVMGLAIICATPLPKWVLGKVTAVNSDLAHMLGYGALLTMFAVCAAFVAGSSYNPFIYFRF